MRKFVPVALGVVALLAAATVALAAAAPVATLTGVITPTSGGSVKNPVNGSVRVAFQVNQDSQSTLNRITYTIPDGVVLDGTGFPTCSVDQLAQGGVAACPKGSQIGSGTALAFLGPNQSRLDFVVTIFVSGPKTLALFLHTSLFDIPVPGTITGQTLDVPIPERVYRPVGSLYSYVNSVDATLGPATTKIKKKVTVTKIKKVHGKRKKVKVKVTKTVNKPYAALKGCTGAKHDYAVLLGLQANPSPPPAPSLSTTATQAC